MAGSRSGIAWPTRTPDHNRAYIELNMRSKDPPEVVELFECISALTSKAITFDRTIVMSVGTRHASEEEFFSGTGAAAYGGRWNPPGIPSVYASCDIITATREANQNFLDYGFSLSAIRPRVTAGAALKLCTVLDLTDFSIRRGLGFTLAELMKEDWQGIQCGGEESWTQAIGRGCHRAGFEGLLVPSARNKGGRNIVVFPGRLLHGSHLTPLAASELPPHPSEWG